MRVKCLAQEHNTESPARAQTQTTRSGDERTNHEAPVVQRLDNAIRRINHYLAVNFVLLTLYPLDSVIQPLNNWGLASTRDEHDLCQSAQ